MTGGSNYDHTYITICFSAFAFYYRSSVGGKRAHRRDAHMPHQKKGGGGVFIYLIRIRRRAACNSGRVLPCVEVITVQGGVRRRWCGGGGGGGGGIMSHIM